MAPAWAKGFEIDPTDVLRYPTEGEILDGKLASADQRQIARNHLRAIGKAAEPK